MPLKPVERRVSDVENKLVLLYCMRALGDVDTENLWRAVVELDLMGFFTMHFTLSDLVNDQLAAPYRGRFREQYVLTASGEENLRLFQTHIPHSIRSRVDEAAPGFRAKFRQERELSFAYGKGANGMDTLRLCLREGELPLLTLLYAPARRAPMTAVQNALERNARAAYRALLDLAMNPLSLEAQAVPPPQPRRTGLPPQAFVPRAELLVGEDALIPLTPREWLIACQGALPDALGGGLLTARALWPDRGMAERMYQAWEAAPGDAATAVAVAALGVTSLEEFA